MTNPFCPDTLTDGVLPPWEVAKAFTFHVVGKDVAEMLGERPAIILGKRLGEHMSSKVCLKSGGHPSARGIRKALAQLCRFLLVPWAEFRAVDGEAARIF